MAIEVGQAHGLAQQFQYDQRLNDLRVHQQELRIAKAENDAKAKLFSDDLEFQNAANSYDNPRIKEYAKNQIAKIGQFVRENPDYQSDVNKLSQLKLMTRELKDNPELLRGVASDSAFKQMNADLAEVAKNPNMHDVDAYGDLESQRQNYLRFGNQYGEEAAKKEGARAFIYNKPQDFRNLSEEGVKLGNSIKARKYKDHGNGGYEELYDDNSLLAAATEMYTRNKRQIDTTYKPKTPQEGVAYAMELIKPGIDLKRKFAEPHYNDALAVKKWEYAQAAKDGKLVDAYETDIRKSKGTKTSPEAITEMLGSSPQAKIYDVDGSFKMASNGQKFVPSGIFKQANTVAQDRGGKFKVSSPKTIGVADGWIEMNENDLDNSGLLDDHKTADRVVKKTRMNAKGKEEEYYLVPAQVEFDPTNEAYRFKYNNWAGLTNKQITELNPIQENKAGRPVEIDSDGNIFDAETKQFLGKQ